MNIKFISFGIVLILFVTVSLLTSCDEGDSPGPDDPQEVVPLLKVTSPEEKSAIYVDGRFTGKVTPAEIEVSLGDHTIGAGQYYTENYLEKEITVEMTLDSVMNIALTENDLQEAKTWKLLFVGINSVTGLTNSGVKDTLTYTTKELDIAYDYLQYSFKKYLEPYSYNTIKSSRACSIFS